jgi:hypothetical protein
VSSRAKVKTTREGCADRENTVSGRKRGGGKDNADRRPAASNGKERRASERAHRNQQVEVPPLMCELVRRRRRCRRWVDAGVNADQVPQEKVLKK